MTRRTSILRFRRAIHVLRVIELHIEVLFESIGESFSRRIGAIYVRVADVTDRGIGRRVLRPMAFKAIFMAGKAGPSRVIRAVVTIRSTNRRVTLACLEEFLVVHSRAL